jgi:hypothetical protein
MGNRYVFNKGKAPIIRGNSAPINSDCYEVFSEETVEQLRLAGFLLVFEGDDDFVPLWATHIPEKTPNQLITTR